ncbi:MAG: hypothetical protein ABI261_04705, partial [Ginsengibacter sp.]
MYNLTEHSFLELQKYCKEEGYKGWDPYDGLSSKVFQALPFLPKKKLPRLMWIQFIKKMPLNLRPVLRIEKGYNPKGLALFISGYSKISQMEDFHE